jgi:putative DNA primase/helicase
VTTLPKPKSNLTAKQVRALSLRIFGHLDKEAPLPPVEESELSVWFVKHRLKNKVLHNTKQGWWYHDGIVWKPLDPTVVTEGLRIAISDLHSRAAKAGVGREDRKLLKALSSKNRIKACVELAKGQVFVDPDEFDTHPDLLNVQNGYVDLTTGTLHEHDPDMRFTKVAGASYIPGSHHPDVTAALEALPPEERSWFKVRLGSSLYGRQFSDEVIFLLGGGSNGKSTYVVGAKLAGGDYVVMLPEKTLMAGQYDHSTELMPLKGARIAILEELPEGQVLPVKRLKLLAGTPSVTARGMRQDNETFEATHTPFVTTNKLPPVRESDEGTWRRLMVLRFPYHYVDSTALAGPNDKVGDLNLRRRIQDNESGQAEAFLAWMVEGAVEYHQLGKMPPATLAVEEATEAWRRGEDMLLNFFTSEIEPAEGRHIPSSDLYDAYKRFAIDGGGFYLNQAVFAREAKAHPGLEKYCHEPKRFRVGAPGRSFPEETAVFPVAAQYTGWTHVKFINERDPEKPPLGY